MRQYWLRNATWENHTKDKIKATLETVDGNKTSRQEMIVSQYDVKGRPNNKFKEIINHVTRERIDANTTAGARAAREKARLEDQRRKDAENTKRLEQLFQAKIDAFEIPEVKDSSNRKLKSRLRKSKTMLEVTALAAAIVTDTLINTPAETDTNDTSAE